MSHNGKKRWTCESTCAFKIRNIVIDTIKKNILNRKQILAILILALATQIGRRK